VELKGIKTSISNQPALDSEYIPLYGFSEAFEKSAENGKAITIALERENGLVSRRELKIHGTPEFAQADLLYAERTLKMLLWAAGGWRVYISGDDALAEKIKRIYSPEGERAFDFDFMSGVYEKNFEVLAVPEDGLPEENESPKPIGGNIKGCRIGFDAGGSDRKVSAVIDGEPVYSEEVLWLPKLTEDPDYHYNEILTAFKTAASKMPRVDAIGVSSAGIYVANRAMVASLFLKVPKDLFEAKVKDIYINAAKAIGDVPLTVVNDGDVSALAGASAIGENEVIGLAMGTSEAVGYVNRDGYVTGWLNELAFAPVDVGAGRARDEWSGDDGVGCKYFSQDAVIRLAEKAGIEIDGGLTLAKKLKYVQELMESGDKRARPVFETIGAYLAHTIPYYAKFYRLKHILLLGRVMSGKGGDIIVETAQRILDEEYPETAKSVKLALPDEKFRRLGQSVVAASL
jgi:predicted NBD/HSP70 family sugar kinase